ncbi:MAG TPA: LuxR C-terminal-related transcriptional regulator, partial [Tepidiformaceae bacterium]|nr:LuxR C-terminal-related transcriptional regulator [Tepidiformaceae bacterium]
LALISVYNDAELLKARGRLKDAARMYERGLALAARHGDAVTGLANLHFGLSELRCEQGELETARGQLQLGAALGMSPVPPSTPYRHCLARARLQQSLGDIAGAIELLDEAEPLYVRTPVPNVRPLAAWRARLWLKQGQLSEALDWTCTQGLSAGAALDYEREYHHITLARALIARYEATRDVDSGREVGELLERLRDAAEAGGRMGAVIEIMVLQAVLHHVQHEIPSALVHLKRALELAGPEGYVGTFVDEGKPIRELLRHAVAGGIGGAYAVGLLAAAEGRSGGDTVAMTDTQGLAEPLTAREVEILRRVAVGLRNQQIADHLVISLPTVKRHIANTYGKLGAGHRTEAVARATELGLL